MEVHSITPPSWLSEFVEAIAPCVYSTGVEAPLSYSWWEPLNRSNDYPGWQIAINLLPFHVVGGSKADGGPYRCGFRLDAGKIIRLFSHLALVEWFSPPRYNDPSSAPELRIEGSYKGFSIRLRVLATAPPDDTARLELNATTDQFRVRTL